MKNKNIISLVLLLMILMFSDEVFSQNKIIVNVDKQELYLLKGTDTLNVYKVSTATNGIGNKSGSNKTPLGKHSVISRVGEGKPIGATFVGRQFTGKISEIITDSIDVADDLVLSRIMRLQGLEEGVNKGSGIDSYKRYIYIHGTNEEGLIGKPASHGCIRMFNNDVIDLFNKTEIGTQVNIVKE
ncbi:MAG: L,D-transpeptidase [Ichthyobacteriaceae bacterium]|nr:L,D-transpeptidase [Ichthyobacteriaceae bacterium]